MEIESDPLNRNSSELEYNKTVERINVVYDQPSTIIQYEANNSNQYKDESSFIIWSIIGNLLCWSACGVSLLCSIPALVFSLYTRYWFKHDNKIKAKRYSLIAYILNILTCIVLILAFSVFYIFNLKGYMLFKLKTLGLLHSFGTNTTTKIP